MIRSTPHHRSTGAAWVAAVVVALGGAWATASAQMVPSPPPLKHERAQDGFTDPGELPEPVRDIELEQKLEAEPPLDAAFVDESGRSVVLGDYFDGERPVLLSFGFYECPALCPMVWQQMARAFGEMGWTPGRQFQVVTISVSPTETPEQAMEHKQRLLAMLDEPEVAAEGWHFLVGESAPIAQVAEAVGFGYKPLPGQDGQFAHQPALVILSPDGRVMRYLDGMRIQPQTLRLSLVEAAKGQVGSLMDQLLLFCAAFDPESGSYKLAIGAMRTGGVLTMLGLAVGIGLMIKIGRRKREALA